MSETRKRGRPTNAERQARAAAQPQGTSRAPAAQNRYDAGGQGKRVAGWNPPSTGPNKAITNPGAIRNRARDQVRNEWTGESTIQKWTTNLIGIGIRARLTRVADAARKLALNDLWDDFCNTCDADGVLNFYGLQTLGVRGWLESGEVFVRRRRRRADDGLKVPLQVQLIESDFVPYLDANQYQGLPAGNTIRSGIERDRRGQRTAYWMYREHPGDGYNGAIDPSKLLRIPANEISHVFMPLRPGQLRGVSILAPTVTQLREIGNYRDAVLLRQQLANLFVLFITNKLGAEGEEDIDPLTGNKIEGSLSKPLQGLSPGLMQELEDGQDVKFANPPEAGTTFSDYIRTELMGPAAASGIPYELFSGDIKDVSDRTLRVVINEFRRLAEQRQWQVVIPMLCQPVRNWWAEAALGYGVRPNELDAVKRVEWAPHGWAYIHPVQDPQGKKIEVDAGFRSRSSVVGERGDDPELVDAERGTDDQREQRLKIGPYSKGAQQKATPGAPGKKSEGDTDGIDNDEYSAPPNAA